MKKLMYYLPGSIIIFLGILIVAIPEILIAIVASTIIMVGIVSLYVGHIMLNSDRRLNYFDRLLWVDQDDTEDFFITRYLRRYFSKF